MFKTIKPCTSPVKIIDIISQKGKLSPRDLNFIHLELSRYIKLSFYLYSQFLNVIYLAERTALAAIFISFKRMVSTCCFRIFAGSTSRLNQLNKL